MKKTKTNALIELGKDLKVLYVEDNKIARESTQNLLNNFFQNVVVAADGVQGLEEFQKDRFDLIIADINMPKMNGIDMIEKIRQTDQEIPILITSAYSDSEYFVETIKLGVEGYLLKPIDLEQFTMMLQKTVEKIYHKKQNLQYKLELEKKVKEQVQELI